MPDVAPYVFALALGAAMVAFANVSALLPRDVLVERYRKNASMPGAVEVDAPDALVDRVRARDRVALVGSAIVTAIVAVAIILLGPPTAQAIGFGVACAAFFSRVGMIAVLAGLEALRAPRAERRISRAGVRSLGDYVVAWPFDALFLVQAGFLALYVPASNTARPEAAGWVWTVAVVSVAASIAGWFGARWLAAQPQYAETPAELYWNDLERQRSLVAVRLVGPFLAAGVTITSYAYGTGASGVPVQPLATYAWVYLVALAALAIVSGLGLKRRVRERLWPSGVAS